MATTEGGQRQQSQFPDRSAVTRDIRSDDAIMQVNETQRLQAAAQAKINSNQHPNQIGEQP